MSDSSDDEPIALKRRKIEHTNGASALKLNPCVEGVVLERQQGTLSELRKSTCLGNDFVHEQHGSLRATEAMSFWG